MSEAPTANLDAAMAEDLRTGAGPWRALPVAKRLAALDGWARRWTEPERHFNAELEAIAAASGLSAPMVAWGARTTCEAWRDGAEELLRQSVGDPSRLDGPRGGVMARGPGLVGHVWASTLPTSGWIPALGTLLTGAGALIKAPATALPAALALAASLSQAHPGLEGCVAVSSWTGGGEQDEALVALTDAVIVSGGAEAVARYASLCAASQPPSELLAFGPGRSVAVVPADALDDPALPEAIALDVAAYDQLGCLSPQTLWIEADDPGVGLRLCAQIAEALSALADPLPRGAVPPASAAAIMQRQGTAAFRGRPFPARDGLILWEPAPYRHDTPLYRTLPVHPFSGGPEGLLARLRPIERRLHAAAVAGDATTRARWADALGLLGVSRVCPPGALPTPPATWHHDGMPWLARLLHFTDIE